MLSNRYWDVEECAVLAKAVAGAAAGRTVRIGLRVNHTQDRAIEPEELRRVWEASGVHCIHVVSETECPGPALTDAARAGHVVAVRLCFPSCAGGCGWWGLDCCEGHPPYAVRVARGGVQVCDWQAVAAWWDRHAVVTNAKVLGWDEGDDKRE